MDGLRIIYCRDCARTIYPVPADDFCPVCASGNVTHGTFTFDAPDDGPAIRALADLIPRQVVVLPARLIP